MSSCNGTCESCDCKPKKLINPIFSVLGIWKRASINRNIRKMKSCLSEASSFHLGYEIVIDR